MTNPTPIQRVKALARNYEMHLERTGKLPVAPSAFLYMDLCELIHRHKNGMTDDATLLRKLAEIERETK